MVNALRTDQGNSHQGEMVTDPRQEKDGSSASDKLESKYANYFEIGYNAFEVLIDFGQMYADGSDKQVHTRVVTSPPYAKELLRLLAETMRQYEAGFGPIQIGE